MSAKPCRRSTMMDRLPNIEMVPVSKLRPAAVNSAIYNAISKDDQRVKDMAYAFATDINVMDPIVRSTDWVIISGHTRHMACELAEIELVPCRHYPILSTDPGFAALVAKFNNNRVKTTDE